MKATRKFTDLSEHQKRTHFWILFLPAMARELRMSWMSQQYA
jgi:hypothetical protein